MRLIETRTVPRPIDEVFAYTADFDNIEQWDPGVASSSRVGDEPLGVGAKFELEVDVAGSTTPMTYEIIEYRPPHRVVLLGTGEKLDAVDVIEFKSDGDSTRIDYTADLAFHGAMRFLAQLARPAIKKVGSRALDGLEAALQR